jgi:hypothetical protein
MLCLFSREICYCLRVLFVVDEKELQSDRGTQTNGYLSSLLSTMKSVLGVNGSKF